MANPDFKTVTMVAVGPDIRRGLFALQTNRIARCGGFEHRFLQHLDTDAEGGAEDQRRTARSLEDNSITSELAHMPVALLVRNSCFSKVAAKSQAPRRRTRPTAKSWMGIVSSSRKGHAIPISTRAPTLTSC
jgi:hypothetical protein